jgi:hypothetical protein
MIPIGFTFNFYGNNYTTTWVNSNGGVAFDASWNDIGPGTCSSVPYPGFGGQDYISAMWDDLYPPGSPGVRYETRGVAPNRELIVRYDVQGYPSTPSTTVFAMVLHETSNRIDVCYFDTNFMSASFDRGIGARSSINHSLTTPGPVTGLQFSCSAPNLVDGLLVQYIHP